MFQFQEIFKTAKKWLCLPLLFIMAWQQWTTFQKYQEKFLHPIQFTKQNYGIDAVTLYGKRFVEIKKLFTNPTRMNYVGEANEEFAFFEGNFALTQYYLAPNLILRNDVVCDTVLYNLYNSIHIDPATNIHLNNGWHIIKDFNNGLIVLAK